VKLLMQQNRISDAARRLEAFATQNPKDGTLDLLRLTLGELRLQEYYGLPESSRRADTNLLPQARSGFDQVVANTNSEHFAQASLNRGWCLWEEGQNSGATNRIIEALLSFETAAEQLPRSPQQAVARFKQADCQFRLLNYPSAVSNYWIVATNYADLPAIASELAPQALYQIVQANSRTGVLPAAHQAVERLVAEYPVNAFSGQSALLFGQAVNRLGKPDDARKFFTDFKTKFPTSAIVPEVELAIARTYEQAGNWKEAVSLYDQWVTNHVGHVSLPHAEFDRAWAHDRSGDATGAFNLFTNYVAQFPASEQAPLAQSWIGDYYFQQEKYDFAELNFLKVSQYTNWPSSDLTFEARMMAGRAAFLRQGYAAALGHFTNLINDVNCPKWLFPEAYCALADTFVRYPEAVGASTNAVSNYNEAIAALIKVTTAFPNSPSAPLAWGRIGDCYLRLAALDAKQYERAIDAYTNVLKSSLADVAARSQAEVGIAIVLEKQAALQTNSSRTALLSEALRHYLNVVHAKNLRDGEAADPFWVKEAAVAAATLAQEQGQWEVAASLYRQLRDLIPPLRKTWEAKLQKLDQVRPVQ